MSGLDIPPQEEPFRPLRRIRSRVSASDAAAPAATSSTIEPQPYKGTRLHQGGAPSSIDDDIGQVPGVVRAQMGLERFDRARYLQEMQRMGGAEEDLGDDDRAVLTEFRSRLIREAGNEFAASQRAADDAPRTVMDKALVGVEAVVGGFVDAIPQTLWGVASIIDNDLPKTLNEAIGIQGVAAPKVGAFLRAFSESSGWVAPELKSAQPLSDTYQQMVRSDEMFVENLPWLTQLGVGAARGAGELMQAVGTGGASVVGRTLAKGTKTVGLEAMSKAALQWSMSNAGKTGMAALSRRVAGIAASDVAGLGARFAAFEGLANYVDPETGLVKDGWERFSHAATTALMMPAFTAISAGAAKLAGKLAGTGQATTRTAFAKWLGGMDDAALAEIGNPTKAWNTFVLQGMPGVPRNLVKTAAASVVQSTIEGIGFSALDKSWWLDGIDAIVDQDSEALERFLGTAIQNSMLMQVLRFGGSARALEAWRMERIRNRQQRIEQTDVGVPRPAEPPIPDADPRQSETGVPEPKPPEPPSTGGVPRQSETEIPDVRPVEPTIPPGEPVDGATSRANVHRMADAVEQRSLRFGVEEALTKKPSAERRAWLEYAARLRDWADGGLEGPEPTLRGKTPAEIAKIRDELTIESQRRASARRQQADLDRARTERVEQERLEQQAAERAKTQQEIVEVRRAVEYLRDAEAMEAKLALDGVGDPAPVESMRIFTRPGEKPRLITYRDGKYYERDLYTTRPNSWTEIGSKRVTEIVAATVNRQPVQAQAKMVDVAAQRALEIRDQFTPEQARLLGAAMRAVATIPAGKDAGVAAALEMLSIMPPMGWEPRHFDTWSQIALRGMTPTAQKAIIESFLAEKPAEQRSTQQEKAEPAAPDGSEAAPTVPTAPGAREGTQEPVEMAMAPRAEDPSPEPAAADVTARVAEATVQKTKELDQEQIEALARSLGFEPTEANLERLRREMREEGVEEVASKLPKADEAGAASVGALAGVAAAAASLAGLYAAGVPAGVLIGVGAIPVVAPFLMRNWATHLYDRVARMGRAREGRAVKQIMLTALGKQARITGEMTDALVRLRVMAGEQPVDVQATGRREVAAVLGSTVAGTVAGAAVGGPLIAPLGLVAGAAFGTAVARMSLAMRGNQAEVARYRAATRHLDRVNWDRTNSYGSSNALEIMDGWRPVDPARDVPGTQEIADAFQNVMVQLGRIETREGMVMTDPQTGRTFRVRYNPNVRRVPRIATQDGADIFSNPNHPGRPIFERAVADLNGATLAEVQAELREMAGRSSFARAAFEIARRFPRMPDWLRVNGEEIQIFETRPFEAAGRIVSSAAGRMGMVTTIGQELPATATAAGAALRPPDRLGARLPATATPEQINNRRRLVRFIETAPNPERALQALTDVQRAMHGMAIDAPLRGFSPGDVGHRVVRALWPIRSLGIALKLSKAAAVNVPEAFGTPATFLGQPAIAGAFLRTWGELILRGVEPLRQEALRYQRMGDVVDPIMPRFNRVLGRDRGVATRGLDIAANVEHLAFPHKAANWMNDIIVARAGEAVLEMFDQNRGRMSLKSRARWMESLNQLDFTKKEARMIVRGQAPSELRVEYLRRLRSYTMGVRQSKAEQGFLQQVRLLRGAVPFQGYVSNNYRVWGRAMREYVRGFARGQVGTPEATAKRRFLVRHVRNKMFASAVLTTAAYLATDYGVHLWKAFAGEDKEAVLENILAKMGQVAVFQEIGAPFIGQIMDAIGDERDMTVRDLLRATLPGSIGNDFVDFWNHTGTFNDRTNRWDLIGKFWEGLVSFTPLLSSVRRITGDPELALAIRRRYELLPVPGGGGAQKYNEFHNKMRQAMTRLREIGDDPESDEWERLENVLLDAIDAEREPDEDLTHNERRKRVASSLRSRMLLGGASEEEQEMLRRRMGPELYGRLEDHDSMVGELIDWVQRQ